MDTHALVWLLSGQAMSPASQVAIAEAQMSHGLLVSVISAWEVGVALRKTTRKPDVGGREADEWFSAVLDVPGTKLIVLGKRIALEAARVASVYRQPDPADCLLIAAARVKKVPIVTRDQEIRRLATAQPDYLRVVRC
jgi:PIN domain nuclease of toxin-antitoxin system